MLIIIEGPDGAGKSTLARKLRKWLGITVVHCSESVRDFEEFIGYAKNGNLILDRSWYSEMVYGKIMRGASRIDYKDMIGLEVLAELKGAMIIYCRADIDTLWERCDETFTKETLNEILIEYDSLLLDKPHEIPVMVYETV